MSHRIDNKPDMGQDRCDKSSAIVALVGQLKPVGCGPIFGYYNDKMLLNEQCT